MKPEIEAIALEFGFRSFFDFKNLASEIVMLREQNLKLNQLNENLSNRTERLRKGFEQIRRYADNPEVEMVCRAALYAEFGEHSS